MKLFAVADVHSYYNELIYELNKNGFDINDPSHKLLICGDLFDRGPGAKQLQAFIMELLEKDKVILIKGNHEYLAEELIDRYYAYILNVKASIHYSNGTFDTMLDLTGLNFFDATSSIVTFRNACCETDYIKHIIPKMLNYYETEKYVFVHSWLPLNEEQTDIKKDWRNATQKEWERATWVKPIPYYKAGRTLKDKTIVLGHWRVSDFWHDYNKDKYGEDGETACYDAFITKEIIALDARTIVSHKVNVVVLEV